MLYLLLLFLLLLPFLSTAVVSNILYWYEALNNPSKQLPPPAPKPWRCFYLWARTVIGYLIGVLVHPYGLALRFINRGKPVFIDRKKPPLLFVHGIYDNSNRWVYLRKKLGQHGYPLESFQYQSFFTPLDEIVANFNACIAKLEAEFPEHKPVIIAHSLGGIISRLWLINTANEQRILGLITLGTPHGGSRLATMAPGKLVRQISPNKEAITRLEQGSKPPTVPCISICSNTDEAVLPADSLVPPEGWKLRIFPETSHMGILFRPRTVEMLLEELEVLERREEQGVRTEMQDQGKS